MDGSLAQGFNLFGRHFLAFQAAAAQLEQLALLSKITQRLGHRHGVIETKGNGAVVVELVLDNVMRATGKSDTGQRVLDDVEFAPPALRRFTRRFVSSSTVMPLNSVSTAKEARSAFALIASMTAAFSDLGVT